MDAEILDELEAATKAFAAAAESNDADGAADLLTLRGRLLERLLDSGPASEEERERLLVIADAGRAAILPLTARRYWLETRIADSRKAVQAQNSLRPYRETKGGRVNVTS